MTLKLKIAKFQTLCDSTLKDNNRYWLKTDKISSDIVANENSKISDCDSTLIDSIIFNNNSYFYETDISSNVIENENSDISNSLCDSNTLRDNAISNLIESVYDREN